ncbi:MAG: hypothetical protein Q4F71_04440 [Paracoccus sp. (in: a-proteobacteria)]|nr:hypothetical protein [Paracoccus sp. (in: a-proteobacteria)]
MRPIRFILRSVGGLWSALMILLMVGSLALSVAMTLVPAVFAAVSATVGAVTGAQTVHRRMSGQIATERSGRIAANARADRLTRELADSRVTYRGARVAARQAVSDTSRRVSRRVSLSAARTVSSAAGEALPVIGIGVIVAATAWELREACELMKDMRELDAALNPDDPISPDEICGMTPPTRAEIWHSVRHSPAAAWNGARGLYDGLPELSFGRLYNGTIGAAGRLYGWAFGAEDETGQNIAESVQ